MSHYRSQFLAACFATASSLIVVPTATKAEVASGTEQSVLLDRSTVKKVIDGIAVKLREDYVFPDKGVLAADALESARCTCLAGDAALNVKFRDEVQIGTQMIRI